jgi:hypothetical protein
MTVADWWGVTDRAKNAMFMGERGCRRVLRPADGASGAALTCIMGRAGRFPRSFRSHVRRPCPAPHRAAADPRRAGVARRAFGGGRGAPVSRPLQPLHPGRLLPGAASQDIMTLAVASGALALVPRLRRGPTRGWAVWLGLMGYLVYAYALYAFERTYNPVFLCYIAVLGLSLWAILTAFAGRAPLALARRRRKAAAAPGHGGLPWTDGRDVRGPVAGDPATFHGLPRAARRQRDLRAGPRLRAAAPGGDGAASVAGTPDGRPPGGAGAGEDGDAGSVGAAGDADVAALRPAAEDRSMSPFMPRSGRCRWRSCR